jgi:hypothetical protein
MIIAPSNYCELRARVSDVLGPERKPLIIGFDGRNGEGKTSAATWLAWQFGMSAIHLDLFIEEQKSEGGAICKWRTDDLARCLKRRGARPIIVEGVLLLDVLSSIEKAADFLVFREGKNNLVGTEARTTTWIRGNFRSAIKFQGILSVASPWPARILDPYGLTLDRGFRGNDAEVRIVPFTPGALEKRAKIAAGYAWFFPSPLVASVLN